MLGISLVLCWYFQISGCTVLVPGAEEQPAGRVICTFLVLCLYFRISWHTLLTSGAGEQPADRMLCTFLVLCWYFQISGCTVLVLGTEEQPAGRALCTGAGSSRLGPGAAFPCAGVAGEGGRMGSGG